MNEIDHKSVDDLHDGPHCIHEPEPNVIVCCGCEHALFKARREASGHLNSVRYVTGDDLWFEEKPCACEIGRDHKTIDGRPVL